MSEQSERKERGLLIAAKTRITQDGKLWRVPSQSGYKPFYQVDPVAKTCDCPDYEKREADCKHIYATLIVIERESSTTLNRRNRQMVARRSAIATCCFPYTAA